MKKRLAIVLLTLTVAVTAVGCTGCNSAWWQNFIQNPVAQVQAFETATATTLSIAQSTWNAVSPLLPAATLAQVGPKFHQAMIAANDALTALSDAVQVAVDAQTPNPDFAKLMQAVTDAVGQVVAIVQDIQNPPASNPGQVMPPTGKAELAKALAAMKHIGHTK